MADEELDRLRDRFTRLGAPDPTGWAESELHEDIAQQARFLLLRGLWPGLIDRWKSSTAMAAVPAASRLLRAGADPADLATAMRAAAYEAVFGVLARIDEGHDPEAPQGLPGWLLVEVDAEGNETGREVGGLHEDLLALDPSGRGGRDLSG